jgi:predicted helicase
MYLENYRSFYTQLKKRYPHIQLIADCDLSGHAEEDLWDWHIYTDTVDMFNRSGHRHEQTGYFDRHACHYTYALHQLPMRGLQWMALKTCSGSSSMACQRM